MADYVDSNGKTKACSMCKKPMQYMGQHGYTQYWDCNDGCGPETVDLQKPSTHCWVPGCQGIVERLTENSDHPYGNKCSDCGQSLRNHPVKGVGGAEDQAVYGIKRKVTNG